MAREYFKNLPNTTTPLTAPRMNNFLDGDEAMGNIVVDSVTAKNLLNSDLPSNLVSGGTWAGTGKTHYYTSTTTFNGGINWFIPVKAGEKYTFSYKQRNNQNVYLYINERSSAEWTSGNVLKQIVNDGTETRYSFTIENDSYLGISFQNNQAVSNVLIEEIQLEKGLTKTDFSLYKGLGYVSGHKTNGNFIKYDDGTLVQWGTIDKTSFLNSTDAHNTVQGINFYRSNGESHYFPLLFIDTNYSLYTQVLQGFTTGASRFETTRTQKVTREYFDVQVVGVEPFTSTGNGYANLLGVDWVAIGRWKA